MKLVKASFEDLKKMYKQTKWDSIIDEFICSREPVAEIKEFTHSSPSGCYGSLYKALQRRKINNIKPSIHGDRVFIVNVDLVKK